NRGDRGEDRVAVISTTAPVQPSVSQHRSPRSESVFPSDHGRLLVEMSVHQDGRLRVAFDLHEDHRRSSFDLFDFDGEAGNVLLLYPVSREVDGAMHVSVAAPLRIEE